VIIIQKNNNEEYTYRITDEVMFGKKYGTV
jgi:hypothetical protein